MHKVFRVKYLSHVSSEAIGSQSMNRPCNGEAISEIQTSATPSPLWDNNIGGLHLPLHKDPYKKLTQRDPQGPWACWEMHNFMTTTKS